MPRHDGDHFLDDLIEAEKSHALKSLQTPQARDAFEYGRVSGVAQGLRVAREIYLQRLEEKDKKQ